VLQQFDRDIADPVDKVRQDSSSSSTVQTCNCANMQSRCCADTLQVVVACKRVLRNLG
jgi:hypothetical protein